MPTEFPSLDWTAYTKTTSLQKRRRAGESCTVHSWFNRAYNQVFLVRVGITFSTTGIRIAKAVVVCYEQLANAMNTSTVKGSEIMGNTLP